MSIKFIYGKSGSGKTYHCLQSIKNRIEKGDIRPLILLVPEQFSFQSEKNLIDTIGDRGLLKASVLSFKRMADKVLDEVGGATNRYINDSGKSILLYKIIEENKDKLKVFKKISRKQGILSNICDTIREFKKYDITIDILKDSLDRMENNSLKNKLQDIIIIFSEFQKRLEKTYMDEEDALSVLAEKLDKSKIFDSAEVWIDEFSSFTPQEYRILEKIMSKAYKVNFTLCMDFEGEKSNLESTDLFYQTKLTEQKLLEIASQSNISYEKPFILNSSPCYKFKNKKDFSHIEHYLFSYPYKVYKNNTENIKIFKSLNKYTEIENTAGDIIRICRDKGFRFKDIAVVSGSLDEYENVIKAVFGEYNIPYFMDKKREISNNPIVVLIISAVEILVKNWSYEAVFRYLKTGLLGFENEEIDILENYVLENGIKGSTWITSEPWKFKTSYSINDDRDETIQNERIDRINSIKDRVREPILKLSNTIKGKKNGKDRCRGLYDFLCEIKVPEKVEQIIQEFKEESRLDKANEYSKIWDIIIDILDQLVDTIGEETFSLDTFSQVLTSGFQEYEIGVIPPSLDQVLVGSITRIKSHNVKALYIIGVNDGIFPAVVPSQGILTDGDRDELKDRGVELVESSRSRAFEEQFLIYTTLTIMDSYLRLSYKMGDADGKTKRPSIIISRIKNLFPKIIEESDVANRTQITKDNEMQEISVPGATFNKLIQNVNDDSNENNIDPLWVDVYGWYRKNQNWSERLNTVLKGFYYTNEIEILDTSKVRNLYGKHLYMSVSKLEKFVQCPFSYFVQYGLRAGERKVYNLTAPDLGSFMHNIIEVFSKKLREQNLTWRDIDRNWCSENVSSIINNTLEERPNSVLNSSKRYMHITSRLNRVLTRAVWLITEHIKRSEFNPAGYELSFGKSGDFPPISVKLHSGEEISLSGRVDRIDIMQKNESTYLRVIDYKSGVKQFDISDLYYGIQIQLLVYLDVILQELEKKMNKEALPSGILYFRLDDPIIDGKENITYDEIENRINKSLKMNGLLLDDTDIIKDMDSDMKSSSNIIPASIKKDGSLSKNSSVATIEQFNMLRKYVRVTMAELCEKILDGNIDISPYKEENKNGCDFCTYSSICEFDTLVKGNRYNLFKKKSVEEIWQDIEKKIEK